MLQAATPAQAAATPAQAARPRRAGASRGSFPAHPHARHTSSPVYRPRRPTATPLYPAVQHHLESFLVTAEEADPLGFGVASWVERDFRAYLRCGILAHGFARARCVDCARSGWCRSPARAGAPARPVTPAAWPRSERT